MLIAGVGWRQVQIRYRDAAQAQQALGRAGSTGHMHIGRDMLVRCGREEAVDSHIAPAVCLRAYLPAGRPACMHAGGANRGVGG